jgi:DNA polymerase
MQSKPREPAGKSKRAAAQLIESLAAAGVTHAGRGRRKAADQLPAAAKAAAGPKAPLVRATSSQTAPSVAATPSSKTPASKTPPSKAAASKTAATTSGDPWEILKCEVAACQLCTELAATRKQTVFGVGNLRPRLCFLGEAPGADEDQQGEPFVGAAGKLLNKIIEACHMSRSDVYILNILKCRPPGNRTPAQEEAANCRGFLERQFALLRPEFVCCLGAVAAQNLLETTTPIGRLRGRLHPHGDMQVLCTYHPAYLLRNPAAKRDVWEDMKLLMREMGTPVE